MSSLQYSNIVSVNSGYYEFNGDTYDENRSYGLSLGNYILANIPQDHPMALLNNDVSNLITYTPVDNSPIIINVSGGQDNADSSGDYFTFTDSDNNPIAPKSSLVGSSL